MSREYAIARRTDPQQSLFGADSVKNVSEVKLRILSILEDGIARTDEEIETVYRSRWGWDATAQSLRTRRSELRDEKLVRFADELGRTRAGNSSRKWTTNHV